MNNVFKTFRIITLAIILKKEHSKSLNLILTVINGQLIQLPQM
jgi:hypothetical protein